MRLDLALVERGLAANRSRAHDAIKRGRVRVDGVTARKTGMGVASDTDLVVDDPASGYVSRAALKLIAGLDSFGIAVEGRNALDVGASTGGFTQVLLERGAAHVTALDVGHGQLAAAIAGDPRVAAIEGLNARALSGADLPHRPDLVVADVSFISLRLALPPALSLATDGASCVLLVKPQFELGPEAIGKGGLVRDPTVAEGAASAMREWLETLPGWRALDPIPSPIAGGSGNREWLLGGVKDRL